VATPPLISPRGWFALTLIYTAVVVGVSIFTLVALGQDDSGLAGIWLILVSLPLSLLLTLLPVSGLTAWSVFTVGGLLQAALLWHHALRRRRSPG
jgi:hypothetical protein